MQEETRRLTHETLHVTLRDILQKRGVSQREAADLMVDHLLDLLLLITHLTELRSYDLY